jgi:hypothetical protein
MGYESRLIESEQRLIAPSRICANPNRHWKSRHSNSPISPTDIPRKKLAPRMPTRRGTVVLLRLPVAARAG